MTTVADPNVGTATFTLTIVYSEPMNTSVAPTVTFPVEDPSATLTFNATSGWNDSTTYVAKYDVADVNATLANIDVQVGGSGVKDLAGNSQVGATFADKFNIDTVNPTVSSVTPNLTNVLDANVGTATFTVTVVYSEAMKQTVAPTVTFTPAVASTLSLNAASGWTGSTTYVAKYDVADANVTVPNIGIGVTLGQDAAGNVQAPTAAPTTSTSTRTTRRSPASRRI